MDAVPWAALVAAIGALIAVITFWFQRGKEIGQLEERLTARRDDVDAKMANLQSVGISALGKAEMAMAQMSEMRVEIAREYVSHRDLVAAEARSASALSEVRGELRGMNDRLDRIIEKFQ